MLSERGCSAQFSAGEVSYNPVFWTMRIEFIGSLLILAYRCLTLSRRSQVVGATIYIILTVSFAPGEWVAYFAFLLGTPLSTMCPRPGVAVCSTRWPFWACTWGA